LPLCDTTPPHIFCDLVPTKAANVGALTAYTFEDLCIILSVTGTILILRPGCNSEDQWPGDLEDLGYTVLSAEEPGQALVHIRAAAVDLVIIDSCGDCRDTVAAFVGLLESEQQAPPFVLASSSPQAPSDSARLGAAAFLPMPCHAVDVTHVLAQVAPKRRAASVSGR